MVALGAAVILGSALIYTTFRGSSPKLSSRRSWRGGPTRAQLSADGHGRRGTVRREGAVLHFSVADRAGGGDEVPVAYTGTVPDPFHEGREVIVTVEKQGGSYVGERNSLITKCPSKYKTAPPARSRTLEIACWSRSGTADRKR